MTLEKHPQILEVRELVRVLFESAPIDKDSSIEVNFMIDINLTEYSVRLTAQERK